MFGEIVTVTNINCLLCKLHILFTHLILKFQTKSLSLLLIFTFVEISSWGSDCEKMIN